MDNYRALGIEREMESEFNAKNPSELKLLMDSSYFEHPHITGRKPAEYCEVFVTGCQHPEWWYRDLVGFRFFCEIRFRTYNDTRTVYEYLGVKLTKTKKIIFRGFSPKDVVVL